MLILIGAVPERLVHGDQSRPLLPSSLAPPGPAVGFSTATLIQGSINGPISRKSLVKSRNQNIFEKFKLNRNLRRIPFNMIYNMSMLRHRFSNEQWGVVP